MCGVDRNLPYVSPRHKVLSSCAPGSSATLLPLPTAHARGHAHRTRGPPPFAASSAVFLTVDNPAAFASHYASALTLELAARNQATSQFYFDSGGHVLPTTPPGYQYALGPRRGAYTVLQCVNFQASSSSLSSHLSVPQLHQQEQVMATQQQQMHRQQGATLQQWHQYQITQQMQMQLHYSTAQRAPTLPTGQYMHISHGIRPGMGCGGQVVVPAQYQQLPSVVAPLGPPAGPGQPIGTPLQSGMSHSQPIRARPLPPPRPGIGTPSGASMPVMHSHLYAAPASEGGSGAGGPPCTHPRAPYGPRLPFGPSRCNALLGTEGGVAVVAMLPDSATLSAAIPPPPGERMSGNSTRGPFTAISGPVGLSLPAQDITPLAEDGGGGDSPAGESSCDAPAFIAIPLAVNRTYGSGSGSAPVLAVPTQSPCFCPVPSTGGSVALAGADGKSKATVTASLVLSPPMLASTDQASGAVADPTHSNGQPSSTSSTRPGVQAAFVQPTVTPPTPNGTPLLASALPPPPMLPAGSSSGVAIGDGRRC